MRLDEEERWLEFGVDCCREKEKKKKFDLCGLANKSPCTLRKYLSRGFFHSLIDHPSPFLPPPSFTLFSILFCRRSDSVR